MQTIHSYFSIAVVVRLARGDQTRATGRSGAREANHRSPLRAGTRHVLHSWKESTPA